MKNNFSKFLYVSYREWANKTYSEICFNIPRVSTHHDLVKHIKNNPELKYIFFIGWSEIINIQILNNYSCFCVHPSMLPLYRGGSPIQNQIINGVIDSGVTLFKMNHKIDAGPIFQQKYLSLKGSLNDVFARISFISADLIRNLILKIENGEVINLTTQAEDRATIFKRRKPNQSEITIKELEESKAIQLYDKIRSLADPYPNAYIKCADGGKLILKEVLVE